MARAYNKAVKSGPVEMEEALKAGQRVEFESETQSCAKAIGSVDMRNMKSDLGFMVAHLAPDCFQACATRMGLSQCNE